MLEITECQSCIIVHRGEGLIVYYNINDNESWLIMGYCNHNGNCLVGDSIKDENICGMFVMNPNRRDIPVRPEIKCKCGLIGVYTDAD